MSARPVDARSGSSEKTCAATLDGGMFALVRNPEQGNNMRSQRLRLIRTLPGAAALAVAVTVAAPPAAAKDKRHREPVGAVYTETNGQVANKLMKFDRYADGRIKRPQVIRTGGQG